MWEVCQCCGLDQASSCQWEWYSSLMCMLAPHLWKCWNSSKEKGNCSVNSGQTKQSTSRMSVVITLWGSLTKACSSLNIGGHIIQMQTLHKQSHTSTWVFLPKLQKLQERRNNLFTPIANNVADNTSHLQFQSGELSGPLKFPKLSIKTLLNFATHPHKIGS